MQTAWQTTQQAGISTILGPDLRFREASFGIFFDWNDVGPEPESIPLAALNNFLPGDTVIMPMKVNFLFTGNTGNTIGAVRIRYEFKTIHAPEPAAALSLPLGAAWLAGLASSRG